ncbi:MAG TPA: FAD-dependent oxidoreductase [Verrucomicrobiales bacterium]|jgi:glycine/D-amino acid oxidase-like deaminating enzyme/nitrite reductase/ring-hydroxylating ferredoxin subunit|nr:FAD-dependent oxidoreductase [Verrucomicrobiales bacterium]
MKTPLSTGNHDSLWQLTAAPLAFSPLDQSITVDVCVVGAGIAGLSVASELAPFGSVAVLDAVPVGSGMTGRTTAHLSNALDDRYSAIEHVLDGAKAKLAAESHTAAIERIGQMVEKEGIDCDWERLDGYLFSPPGEKIAVLQKEYEAARRAGIQVEWATQAPVAGWNTGSALRFPDQAQLHPVKYLTGLAKAVVKQGGKIFTGTRATNMRGGALALVETDTGHVVRALNLVVATNTPVNDRFVIHTKQASYTTSVVVFRCESGTAPHVLLWDTSQTAGKHDSYHYVRSWRSDGEDFLIVGGEDHKTGQFADPESSFKALENWARARFPMAGKLVSHWSGQVFEPLDGMAFIGRNPADEDNVYIVTGDSGNGITHGAVAGMLIRDLIQKRSNPWSALYDPHRMAVRTLPRFLRENLNATAQLRDYITPGEVRGAESILPGEGAIIREGVHKTAVFRDEDGTLYRLSPVCPHLKGIVRWNAAEQTWDCPCHGARFDARGRVICGPANSDLEEVEDALLEPAFP